MALISWAKDPLASRAVQRPPSDLRPYRLQVEPSICKIRRMIPRDAKDTALRLALGFPILAVTGPRPSGMTTLSPTSRAWWTAGDAWATSSSPAPNGGDDRYGRQGMEVFPWRSVGQAASAAQ